ncbi:MAG: AAA family ATPase [Endomicrobium sp.]|nr:AAA family ATPase [Endomicrobium sp.]
MFIERDILKKLTEWKNSKKRKPLILSGARQTGKTLAMQTFGKRNFKYTAYFNFDETEELKHEFEQTKDPKRLIERLSFYTDVPIDKRDTLIIFDEIQECNKALNSLKYFSENAPEYCVVCAGSLLGVSLSKGDSFPVGKVDFMNLYPLTFSEFLAAQSNELFLFINNLSAIETIPQIIFAKFKDVYQKYQISGGMPAAVSELLDNTGTNAVEERLQGILNSYVLDFAKHIEKADIARISAIWNSVPSQLAKENKKFIYKLVKPGARAREYEDALLWLEHCGLIYRVFSASKPALPLRAYDDTTAFKIYLSDIGLLRKLAKLPAAAVLADNNLFVEFKGALAENFVLQSLITQFEVKPRYWVSQGKAEIDFLLQNDIDIVPIEVKSAANVSSKSLSVYDKEYSPEFRIRYSLNNLKCDGNLINIPIFFADWTKRILSVLADG